MSSFYYAKAKPVRALTDVSNPWCYYVPPFRIAPHIWSIGGNNDVCAYIINTGGGSVVIDTGVQEFMYLMIDSIYQAGFDPHTVKMICLTHWHGDHSNGAAALQKLSGAPVSLSRKDIEQRLLHAADVEPFPLIPTDMQDYPFEELHFPYVSIERVQTPGHTPGTVSFFINDTDEETGICYHCALHGGLGRTEYMTSYYLRENHLPLDLAERFIQDCIQLASRQVDIVLPSHMHMCNMLENIADDPTKYKDYIQPKLWGEILNGRVTKLQALLKGETCDAVW